MIVEDILLATSALTLSPRKDSSGCILSVSTCKSDRSNQLLPYAPSRRQNGASAIPYPRDFTLIKPSVVPALSTLIGSARRVGSDPKMPRGVKRPSAGLEDAQDSLTSKATSASAKPAKPADNHASRAYEPIVISDDSDSDLDPGPAQKHPNALFAQTLSSKFTYHSPTKAPPQRKTISTKSNSEVLQPTASSARLPITLSSSSSSLPAAAAKTHSPFVKEDTSTSTSTSLNDPSVPVRKKPKTSKAAPHAAMQLKKTIERAKEAGVSPLDLSPVSAAGFRLLSRCSFCAQAFTKAPAPKVKQQHMAFCAALSKIASTETAVSLIADDVRSALERDEADKRKVRDDRTMLQDVVQEADIVMHEGRASQIAASPKKRGKDAVITKKAIKRSTKLPLFVSEQHSDTHASASHAKHKLLPAREAMAAARDIANQLIGSSIPLAMHSSKVEQDDESNGKTEAVHEPSHTSFEDAVLITPKKRKERSFTPVDDVSHAQKDGNRDASKILSDLSLEQVLASISPASPEKKSPVKALQVSRQRQASREQDMSLGIDGARHSLGSPSHLSSSSPGSSLPRTQAFGPSKLAQRQQASAGPKLFGAETTSRSLLDLVSDKREADSSPTRGETKRKVIDTDVQDIDAKRQKSTALDSDMDVDDQTVDTALSAQPGEFHHSTTGKLQDHEPSPSHTEPLATREKVTSQNIDTKASPRLEQAAAEEPETSRSMLRDGSDEKTAEFDAESIEEDDDDEDAQSYLELLEPLEPPPDPIISQTCSLSESSFDDEVDGPDASEIAYRSRRMLIASGGGSITLDYRRKTGRADASSRTSRETVFPACSQNQARYRSVSNSDPELLLVTDDSCSSSPQP
ncbi:uncharacterized protein UTRI_01662_B [Ustilago trichophora]|uniref:Uncharacterized protein n=1 Tax=Ustilago trichophora TaxID=86804 RepID=A0A5C3E3K0_9BASI|nr:uncharacterized protein UTRI_01662_B [Ustilago trichophora]